VRHKDDDREFLPSTGAIREQRRRDYISADGQRFVFALLRPQPQDGKRIACGFVRLAACRTYWGKRVASPRKKAHRPDPKRGTQRNAGLNVMPV
jgi:hypothetical protein